MPGHTHAHQGTVRKRGWGGDMLVFGKSSCPHTVAGVQQKHDCFNTACTTTCDENETGPRTFQGISMRMWSLTQSVFRQTGNTLMPCTDESLTDCWTE